MNDGIKTASDRVESFILPDIRNPYNIDLKKGHTCNHFGDLEKIRRSIEAALTANNGELLRKSIARVSGQTDLRVTAIEPILKTAGNQYSIVRLDCHTLNSSGKTEVMSLAAMIPQSRDASSTVQLDMRAIVEARKREAEAMGTSEDSDEYEAQASFPALYGESRDHNHDGEGHQYVCIGKWYKNMDGIYVFGQLIDKSQDKKNAAIRRVYVAANIQKQVDISPESIQVIIMMQMAMAEKCRIVLTPLFSAGDFMMNLGTGRFMLSTLRPALMHPNTYWRQFAELVPGGKESKIIQVACQLLQIATAISENSDKHSDLTKHPFFTYGMDIIYYALQDLRNGKKILSQKEWIEVGEFLKRIRNKYAPLGKIAQDIDTYFDMKYERINQLIVFMDSLDHSV